MLPQNESTENKDNDNDANTVSAHSLIRAVPCLVSLLRVNSNQLQN